MAKFSGYDKVRIKNCIIFRYRRDELANTYKMMGLLCVRLERKGKKQYRVLKETHIAHIHETQDNTKRLLIDSITSQVIKLCHGHSVVRAVVRYGMLERELRLEKEMEWRKAQ